MATVTINTETVATSAASSDEILFWNVASGYQRKITKANFIGATLTGGGTIATGGNTLTVSGTSGINGTLSAAGFTLTAAATGTAALLGTAQTFTALQRFNSGITFDGTSTLANYVGRTTWTPVVYDATTGGNAATAATSFGSYVRIGSTVILYCRLLDINTTGLTAGNAIAIRGLPIAVANVTNYTPSCSPILANVTFTGDPKIYSGAGLNYLRLAVDASGAGTTNLNVSALTSTTADITFTLIYEV